MQQRIVNENLFYVVSDSLHDLNECVNIKKNVATFISENLTGQTRLISYTHTDYNKHTKYIYLHTI